MLILVILVPLALPAQRRMVSVPFRSVNTYMLVEASVDGRPVPPLVFVDCTIASRLPRSVQHIAKPRANLPRDRQPFSNTIQRSMKPLLRNWKYLPVQTNSAAIERPPENSTPRDVRGVLC
jgi:hypothetical protein